MNADDPNDDDAPTLQADTGLVARRRARALSLASLTQRVRDLESQLRHLRAKIARGTTPLRRPPPKPPESDD